MSYNATIILNEIFTNSTFTITPANCGLFRSREEWFKLKAKIQSIPKDCQLIYLEGWIKRRVEEDNAKEHEERMYKEYKEYKEREKKAREERDKKAQEEREKKAREEREKKAQEEREKKAQEEREKKAREERESSVARHTLFAHYGSGLAFAMPTPGYPGKHLVHMGGGTFIPSTAPVGFISPGFIPGPCFVRAHRF